MVTFVVYNKALAASGLVSGIKYIHYFVDVCTRHVGNSIAQIIFIRVGARVVS